MDNLWINETWINKAEGYSCGESDFYETFTADKGVLFRSMQGEYGRCVGRMYIDRKDGSTQSIGWVFEKTAYYEDTKEPYLQETWVTVCTKPPKITRTAEYFYA